MECFCCKNPMELARKVKIRRLIDYDPSRGGPGSPQYMAYTEETTYRRSVICIPCYIQLDNELGAREINGARFTIAVSSRHDRAITIDETKYQQWQKKEAEKIGVELSPREQDGD